MDAGAKGRPIQIVGGGLAGLVLGIRLRLSEVPTIVWEAGHYPRHRVCGEVLSGRGYDVLAALGLIDATMAAGARLAQTAAFFSGDRGTPVRNLPRPALCLSRYALDHLLAVRFRELDGDLREGSRWQEPTSDPGVVRASGRVVQTTDRAGCRWFGLKAHARRVEMQADVEMHLVPGGYVGLCRLTGDRVNVCGLFRRSPTGSRLPAPWRECLRGPGGSCLRKRLALAEWEEDSFCAVAGLPIEPRRGVSTEECRIGDALTVIPPVTGNGMSMALESAEIVAPALLAYSGGQVEWPDARLMAARACDGRFARRLRWGRLIHRGLFRPIGRAALLMSGHSDGLWRTWFYLTR
jgi:menaquinone-9 beta-reductase